MVFRGYSLYEQQHQKKKKKKKRRKERSLYYSSTLSINKYKNSFLRCGVLFLWVSLGATGNVH